LVPPRRKGIYKCPVWYFANLFLDYNSASFCQGCRAREHSIQFNVTY
jgi:hypothetical protein